MNEKKISGESETITMTNYGTYLGIAKRNMFIIEELLKERNSKKVIDNSDIDYVCTKNAAIQRSAMITVIFSVMTLESFINTYITDHFSKSFVENYLEKLDLKSKWIIYPLLVKGSKINTDSQAFEHLVELINLRNQLVHQKPKTKRICDLRESDWVTEQEAEGAANTVNEIFSELAKIDSSVKTDWIKEVAEDPYI